MWFWNVAIAAAQVSPGTYVSAPTAVDPMRYPHVAGGSDGWLLVGFDDVDIVGQRVGPDGALVDPTAAVVGPGIIGFESVIYMRPWVIWDGLSFGVLVPVAFDYYDERGHMGLFRVDPSGPFVPTTEPQLPNGVEWYTASVVSACDGGGRCVAALGDEGTVKRYAFDGTGVVEPPAEFTTDFEQPIDAARDGGATLVIGNGGNLGFEAWATWLPDDPADPAERVWVDSTAAGARVAVSDGGISLVVWTDSQALLAQRLQRGVGLLESQPLVLATGSFITDLTVAWSGGSFLVAWSDDDAKEHHLARFDELGTLIDHQVWPGRVYDVQLEVGAPGHVLWSWTDNPSLDRWYVIVEADVPDGGACSVDDVCLSGACTAGVCGADTGAPGDTAAPGDTGAPPATGDTSDTGAPTAVEPDDNATRPGGCGCAQGPETAAWFGLPALLRRR